jgi:hypothetical protein
MMKRFRVPFLPGAEAMIAFRELSVEIEGLPVFLDILRTIADQLGHPEQWQGTSAGETDRTDGVLGFKSIEHL